MAESFDRGRWDAVIFDVDGTLYEQGPLRRKMAIELLAYCALRPWRVGLLRRLQTFRSERERLSDERAPGVGWLQYERPASRLGVPPEILEREVGEWMERRPLRHLASCRVAGVRRFFGELHTFGIRIGVLSDYPAQAKVEALGLSADVVVAGVDPEVDRLKPHPAGLEAAIARLGVAHDRCLLIGDRDDRDGECARAAGVACLLRSHSSTFLELLSRGPDAEAEQLRADGQ
jgi:phosphoglycolate phosphatase/putative hydrolase of the HAD superfamily